VPNGGLPASAASSAPGRVVDHADFQGRGAAEDVLGLGRVLHARQLDDDAVGALLLDHRLGDAEFVDPVVQGGDVLLEREFADLQLRFGFSVANQLEVAAFALLGEQQIGLAVGDGGIACLVAGFGVSRKRIDQALAFTADAGVAQVLVAQHGAQVGGQVESRRLVSAPFMSTCSRKCTPPRRSRPRYIGSACSAGQPLRRGGEQVQGDDVLRVGGIRVEGFFQDVLGLQLGVGILEAGLDAVEVELDAVMGDAGGLSGFFDAGQGLLVDLDRGLGAGHLHRRRFAEEIGQGIDEAQHQRDGDDDVLPEWVAIHGGFKAKKAASGRLLG
jgi:hypothetical protein